MKTKMFSTIDNGLNYHFPRYKIPDGYWAEGNNIHFMPGYLEKSDGWSALFAPKPLWQANHAYSIGDYVTPTVLNRHVYRCSTAGTSANTEPTWPTTAHGTVTDGTTLVWDEIGVNQLDSDVVAIDNYYKHDDSAWLIFCTQHQIYYYSPTYDVCIDITGVPSLTWGETSLVCTENAQNFFIYTNGLDPVKYWDGVMPHFVDLPGINVGTVRANSTAYQLGDIVHLNPDNGYCYQCITAGTTASTQPTMATAEARLDTNDLVSQTTDGTVVWKCYLGAAMDLTNLCTAKTLVYYNNFLLLGDTTEDGNHYPQRVRWCQIGDLSKWMNYSDLSGYSGYADLVEGVDWIQSLTTLGDYLVVYKERSIQVLSFVGGDDIWNRRQAITGIGMLSPNSIVDLGDSHLFIGHESIYSFDLMQPKVAGEPIIDEFFRTLHPTYAHMTGGFLISETFECTFPYVSINSTDFKPDKALVYNYTTKAWSIRDYSMTAFGYYEQTSDMTIDTIEEAIDDIAWEIDSSTAYANFPLNIAGDKNGIIYKLGGTSKNGAALDCYVASGLTDLGDPTILKRLKRIQLMVSRENAYNLDVTVYTAANVDEPMVAHGPYPMLLNQSLPPWIDCDLTDRYFAVKFSTSEQYQPFKLFGYILYFEDRGLL